GGARPTPHRAGRPDRRRRRPDHDRYRLGERPHHSRELTKLRRASGPRGAARGEGRSLVRWGVAAPGALPDLFGRTPWTSPDTRDSIDPPPSTWTRRGVPFPRTIRRLRCPKRPS